MLNGIDPSVTDEADPLSIDKSLSAFETANGFRTPPESSSYAPEFLTRYRAAQRARVERIDASAKAMVARKSAARKRLKAAGSRDDAILAAYSPIFQVWRTDADPRCFDLSLEPSDRAYGSLWSAQPHRRELRSVAFGRVCTPESWLSNWSALSSNASMERCAPAISQPVVMVEYTGDNGVFPKDADAVFAAIGSADKPRHRVHGNHHGRPLPKGRPMAGDCRTTRQGLAGGEALRLTPRVLADGAAAMAKSRMHRWDGYVGSFLHDQSKSDSPYATKREYRTKEIDTSLLKRAKDDNVELRLDGVDHTARPTWKLRETVEFYPRRSRPAAGSHHQCARMGRPRAPGLPALLLRCRKGSDDRILLLYRHRSIREVRAGGSPLLLGDAHGVERSDLRGAAALEDHAGGARAHGLAVYPS